MLSKESPIRVRPAAPADVRAITRLFDEYPYKTVQRVAQRLDRERLNAFYAAGLARSLEAGGAHWVAEDDSGVVALAGLGGESWHSEIYGLKMGKLAPWLCTIRPEAGAALLDAALTHARAQGFEHLSVRVDGEDFANLHLFEGRGWRTVDVSMKFSRPLPVVRRHFAPPAAASGWTVEPAGPGDHEWIRLLGSTTHGGTHYLNDPALPAERTRVLFARWIDRCLERLAYRVYVLRDAAGVGRGFVTYLRAGAFAREVGATPLILDFVLLDPAVRGGGFGPWFIEETLALENEAGFDYCELRTSAHNLPAVQTYEKLGFRLCATDFALHWRVEG